MEDMRYNADLMREAIESIDTLEDLFSMRDFFESEYEGEYRFDLSTLLGEKEIQLNGFSF